MSWSISRAAKETGLSKSTISRAIKSGRISAEKRDDGAYLIEPVELFRVYPRGVAQPPDDAVRNPDEQPPATPSAELEILRVKLEMTEAILERERETSAETIADLRKRLDMATGRVLELTKVAQPPDDATHDAVRNPKQPPVRRGLWGWIRGR